MKLLAFSAALAPFLLTSAYAVTIVNTGFEAGDDNAGIFPFSFSQNGSPATTSSFDRVGNGGGLAAGGSIGAGSADFGGFGVGGISLLPTGATAMNVTAEQLSTIQVSFDIAVFGGTTIGNPSFQRPGGGFTNRLPIDLPALTDGAFVNTGVINFADFGTAALEAFANDLNTRSQGGMVTGADQFQIQLDFPRDGSGDFVASEIRLDNLVVETVPEPSSALLLGLSGLALAARRRR